MSRRYINVKELAHLIGRSPSTVYRWADEGVVEDFRIGGSVFIVLDDHLRDILEAKGLTFPEKSVK